MRGVAVASSTKLAADGGAGVAELGGNAVDAAIAAALVSCVTEPGICSLGCGGFVTVWEPGGEPLTVDGYVEMPGRAAPRERFGGGGRTVHLEYGGGVTLVVGHGSVATPGGLAGLALAAGRWGSLPWRELVEPAYRHAHDGFALPRVSHNYLIHSHDKVFGWNDDSFRALHRDDGALLEPGDPVRVPHLAESLRAIADEGAETFYRGDLARRIAADSEANGGLLTAEDLEAYRPLVRPSLRAELDGWTVATNPPPALGGATLVAMLRLMEGRPRGEAWLREDLERLVRVQEGVFRWRETHLDLAEDLDAELARLLDEAVEGELRDFVRSPSTVHTSAVDADGLACAVTLSAGYGSGVMPPGTGIWMNNCLGELELNRRGFHAWPVGARLPSNMAPTVARHPDGRVLSLGSAGASRITTAILQTVVNHLHVGMPLPRAVAHPRLHVEIVQGEARVAHEPGVELGNLPWPRRPFEEPSMFFGGVGAAARVPGGGFAVAADPRRVGGTAIGGWPHD